MTALATSAPTSTSTSTSTSTPASTSAAVRAPATTRHPLLRAVVVSGAVAAVATTAIAAAAHAAGVPFEIDGEAIPLAGFAQLTVVAAVLGGLLAAALNRWSARAHDRFVATAVVLTALSCVPSIAFPPDVASKLVLVATHVVAALIIVPRIARRTVR